MGVDTFGIIPHKLSPTQLANLPHVLDACQALKELGTKLYSGRIETCPFEWFVEDHIITVTEQDLLKLLDCNSIRDCDERETFMEKNNIQEITLSNNILHFDCYSDFLCVGGLSRWGHLFFNPYDIDFFGEYKIAFNELLSVLGTSEYILYPDSMYKTQLIGDNIFHFNNFGEIMANCVENFGLGYEHPDNTPDSDVYFHVIIR